MNQGGTMSRLLKTLVAAGMATMLSACASEVEKEARRQNAFDLAGIYTATLKTGSSLDFVMTVTNETGRHDVLANVERGTLLTSQETQLLQKHGLNSGTVSAFYGKTLILGRGKQNEIEGGENVSDDFGESSRVRVGSDVLKYDQTRDIFYSLAGTIKKSDFVLRGSLSLYVRTAVQKTDQEGKPYTTYETDSVTLNFSASPENVYFTQYFGTWSGTTTLNEDVSTDLTKVSSLMITKSGDAAFTVSPASSSIVVNGQTYTFESKAFSNTHLSDKSVPLVEITFRRSDTERVMFVGQIRSLGNMTGSVLWLSGSSRVHLGSFLFKRR